MDSHQDNKLVISLEMANLGLLTNVMKNRLANGLLQELSELQMSVNC